MKERDVEGLEQLRLEYKEKLSKMKGYDSLVAEFHRKSLELVRKSLVANRLRMNQTNIHAARGDCGFCADCITDCSGCVCYN